jgi:predicted metal-dependent hydrolase
VEDIENLRERLEQGIDLFNREYFFEAHDAFEELWMEARELNQRELFHGLVNVATGFYHYRMGNRKGMQSQLQKGADKLSQVPPCCLGVNIKNCFTRFSRTFSKSMRR